MVGVFRVFCGALGFVRDMKQIIVMLVVVVIVVVIVVLVVVVGVVMGVVAVTVGAAGSETLADFVSFVHVAMDTVLDMWGNRLAFW